MSKQAPSRETPYAPGPVGPGSDNRGEDGRQQSVAAYQSPHSAPHFGGEEIKISSTKGIFTWAPKRLTTTVAVFNSAKIAIIIRITIEAMVVDCFFMENSPSCFL